MSVDHSGGYRRADRFAQQVMMPVDYQSGIPLHLDPRYMAEFPGQRPSDWDKSHPWFYKRHPLLQGVGGEALRGSRVQWANYFVHHEELHPAFSRPVIPSCGVPLLRPILFGVGGYVPAKAVSFSMSPRGNFKHQKLELPKSMRVDMWEQGDVFVHRPATVARYFAAELLKISRVETPDDGLLKLIRARSDEEHREHSTDILAFAAAQLTAPLYDDYQSAYNQGLLPGGESTPGATVLNFTIANYAGTQTLHQELLQTLQVAA